MGSWVLRMKTGVMEEARLLSFSLPLETPTRGISAAGAGLVRSRGVTTQQYKEEKAKIKTTTAMMTAVRRFFDAIVEAKTAEQRWWCVSMCVRGGRGGGSEEIAATTIKKAVDIEI
jgi:hypothetical protein